MWSMTSRRVLPLDAAARHRADLEQAAL